MIFSIQWHNYDVKHDENKVGVSLITKIFSMRSKRYDARLQIGCAGGAFL